MGLRPPRSGGARQREPEVDYRGLWENYSRWVGEAGERYQGDVERIGRMPGMGEEARERELGERRTAYESELAGFRRGPTYGQLKEGFKEEGARGTLEDYYTGRFGGFQPTTEESVGETEERARQGTRRAGSGVGTEADIAGLGRLRPWWAV